MRIPSVIVSLLVVIVYLFAALPIILGSAFLLTLLGFPISLIKLKLSEATFFVQAVIATIIVIVLLKKYHLFLLSNRWKEEFLSLLKVGTKWAVPILFVHFVIFIVPWFREMLLEKHQIIKESSIDIASPITTVAFTMLLIIGALSEELIFRGVILQKINSFFSENKSIVISAALFAFSHFIYSHIKVGHLISSFVVGLLCGFAFVSTRSCISASVPHLLNNLIFVGYLWMGKFSW